jgi:hypothetical protein
MSSKKKSKVLPAPKYSKADFKKVNPTDLKKLGYSEKAERYKVPTKLKKDPAYSKYIDKNGTISKRKQAEIVFRMTNEQKAEAIKTGKRVILQNAPKQARAAKIQKSIEQKIKSGKIKSGQILPQNLKNFKNRQNMRYDYYLGHSIDSIAEHKIIQIIASHPPNSLARIVVTRNDIINSKNKTIGDGRSSELFFLKAAITQAPNFLVQLESKYAFLDHDTKKASDFLPIQYWLYVYVDY